jgi:hypothetical protein
MNLNVRQHMRHIQAMRKANAYLMLYQPQRVVERSRGGAVISATQARPHEILINVPTEQPTFEDITAFGDTSEFKYGQKAIFHLEAEEAFCRLGKVPNKNDALVWQNVTYSIMAISNLTRGGKTIRHDLLVGFE